MSIPVNAIPRVLRGVVVMRHGMVPQVAGQRKWVLGRMVMGLRGVVMVFLVPLAVAV